tara:strand:- start:185 stop:631 length:447 start_codon:yes stop_codon:yes gene_type:complete
MANIEFDDYEVDYLVDKIKDQMDVETIAEDVFDNREYDLRSSIAEDISCDIAAHVDLEPVLDQVNEALERDCCSKISDFITGIINCIASRQDEFFNAMAKGLINQREGYLSQLKERNDVITHLRDQLKSHEKQEADACNEEFKTSDGE